jgi:hypothetical protein
MTRIITPNDNKPFYTPQELFHLEDDLSKTILEDKKSYDHLEGIDVVRFGSVERLPNAEVLLKEIYSHSFRHIDIAGKKIPFVSEIGLRREGSDLVVDRESVETLEKVIGIAKPYWEAIRKGKREELNHLVNWPDCYVSQIIYDGETYILPARPDTDCTSPDHTHFVDIGKPNSIFRSHTPSPDDFAAPDVDGAEEGNDFTILYAPYNGKRLVEGEIPDYFRYVNEQTIVGIRPNIDRKGGEVKVDLLTG